MSNDLKRFHDFVVERLGTDAVRDDEATAGDYSTDDSFAAHCEPAMVVRPRSATEVQAVVLGALECSVPLVPVSSSGGNRQHGDTVPSMPGSAIVDLSKMNRILRIDRRNRVAVVEPGVTFSQLIPEVEGEGMRVLQPLLPRAGKSALTSALEREPTLIPRHHWDASDPLLCTEVVFGTGDIFRTGTAAGPGSLEEQHAVGMAQKNPMGPAQFSLFQTIQGAQGSFGIVTWASLKCELAPSCSKAVFAGADSLDGLTGLAYELLKSRTGDELFLMNRASLETLSLGGGLGPLHAEKGWALALVLAGHGRFAEDKVRYLEGDLQDFAKMHGVTTHEGINGLDATGLLASLHSTRERPWRYGRRGGCQTVFFITTLDRAQGFVGMAEKLLSEVAPRLELGAYVQPLVQGCNCHMEFQLHYDPKSPDESRSARDAFSALSERLLDGGAFFSRPYGGWAQGMFSRMSPECAETLRKVKQIFDPKCIMKPGALGIGGGTR